MRKLDGLSATTDFAVSGHAAIAVGALIAGDLDHTLVRAIYRALLGALALAHRP